MEQIHFPSGSILPRILWKVTICPDFELGIETVLLLLSVDVENVGPEFFTSLLCFVIEGFLFNKFIAASVKQIKTISTTVWNQENNILRFLDTSGIRELSHESYFIWTML